MESKPKVRQVRKASSALKEPPKPKRDTQTLSAEVLIRQNGNLIESLFASDAWTEVAFPLLQESIASVSGRFTNGRYHHGSLTKDLSLNTPFLSGYQKALMDFYNHLNDFILTRDQMIKDKKINEADKKAPLYNPFLMEEGNSLEEILGD